MKYNAQAAEVILTEINNVRAALSWAVLEQDNKEMQRLRSFLAALEKAYNYYW